MNKTSIYKYLRENRINEELHVDGLDFLGSAYGYELYDARTYEGAQALTVGATNQRAGEGWTRDAGTFAANINDRLHLYLFVIENTNHAIMGCLNQGQNSLQIEINRTRYNLENVNYIFQDVNGEAKIGGDVILPLFLLPHFTYTNGEKGLIFSAESIVANYKGLLNPQQIPEEEVIPEGINRIRENAFSGYPVPSVTIDNPNINIQANAFADYTGTIRCAAENLESTDWNPYWAGNNTNVVWGIHLSDEERARRAEAARIERERQEREEQERREREERERQEREAEERRKQELQNAETISILKYKESAKDVTILGCKRGRENLTIPKEINGKPVTTIAQFAFINDVNLREVRLPSTVKVIGKAAFFGCENARIFYYKNATVYKDAFTGCRGAYPSDPTENA